MKKKLSKKMDITVISLGGSLIVPREVDWQFLKKFRSLIVAEIKKGKHFAIITGGGNICREYQKAATKVTKLTKDDRDWLGVHTTRLNAHLIKTIFRAFAHPRINKNPRTKEDLLKHFSHGEKIIVAAGWRPGWSTDYVATILAQRLGAKKLINLSNIKYACTKDPKKHPEAEIIKETDWKKFRRIVGSRWDPGLNMPFDPVASKLADEINLEVIIAEGKNIPNLRKILKGDKFQGTVVKN